MADIATYVRINWQNKPSVSTPLNETNLNHIDDYLYNLSVWANSLPSIPENTSELNNDSDFKDTEGVNALIKTAIENLGSILIFKGVVDTYASLPSTGDNGDVYMVTDDSDSDVPHGTNTEYYWNGSSWEYFSSEHKVDLSDYFTKEQIEELLSNKVSSVNVKQVRYNGDLKEFQYSTDGETWTTPLPNRYFTSPRSPLLMKDAGPFTLAVFNPIPYFKTADMTRTWGRTPMVCAISDNRGEEFTRLVYLEDDPENGYCYPAIFDGGSYVLISYYVWHG